MGQRPNLEGYTVAAVKSDQRRAAASNMLGLVFEIRSDRRPTFTFSEPKRRACPRTGLFTVQDE